MASDAPNSSIALPPITDRREWSATGQIDDQFSDPLNFDLTNDVVGALSALLVGLSIVLFTDLIFRLVVRSRRGVVSSHSVYRNYMLSRASNPLSWFAVSRAASTSSASFDAETAARSSEERGDLTEQEEQEDGSYEVKIAKHKTRFNVARGSRIVVVAAGILIISVDLLFVFFATTQTTQVPVDGQRLPAIRFDDSGENFVYIAPVGKRCLPAPYTKKRGFVTLYDINVCLHTAFVFEKPLLPTSTRSPRQVARPLDLSSSQVHQDSGVPSGAPPPGNPPQIPPPPPGQPPNAAPQPGSSGQNPGSASEDPESPIPPRPPMPQSAPGQSGTADSGGGAGSAQRPPLAKPPSGAQPESPGSGGAPSGSIPARTIPPPPSSPLDGAAQPPSAPPSDPASTGSPPRTIPPPPTFPPNTGDQTPNYPRPPGNPPLQPGYPPTAPPNAPQNGGGGSVGFPGAPPGNPPNFEGQGESAPVDHRRIEVRVEENTVNFEVGVEGFNVIHQQRVEFAHVSGIHWSTVPDIRPSDVQSAVPAVLARRGIRLRQISTQHYRSPDIRRPNFLVWMEFEPELHSAPAADVAAARALLSERGLQRHNVSAESVAWCLYVGGAVRSAMALTARSGGFDQSNGVFKELTEPRPVFVQLQRPRLSLGGSIAVCAAIFAAWAAVAAGAGLRPSMDHRQAWFLLFEGMECADDLRARPEQTFELELRCR